MMILMCGVTAQAAGPEPLMTSTEPQAADPGVQMTTLGRQMTDPTRVFPLPSDAGYTYEEGYGDPRTFGGDRSHEGIDIIVDKGTPVRSVCNGVVTNKGWLTLGGWRIGVMDAFGVYHYYAHMSAYADVEIGDEVSAGQVLGYVGSTGYGPEGTDDQMVPHLHFGLYVDNVAIDAYPFLQAWEGR